MCSVGRVQHIWDEHFRVVYPECPEIEVKSQHFSVFLTWVIYSNTCKNNIIFVEHIFQPCALMDFFLKDTYAHKTMKMCIENCCI